ncbi:MAG: hypothetical protein ABH826_01640 [Patescibacteria group bacterium]|nr:hypothetical protein [Patescibacteria group bacterium]
MFIFDRLKPYALISICILPLSAWAVGIVSKPPLWATAVLAAIIVGNTGILIWRQFQPLPKEEPRPIRRIIDRD